MYAILKDENSERTDADISQLADSFLTTVQAEIKEQSGANSLKLSIGNAITEHAYRDYLFSVFREDGMLIEASPLNFSTSRKSDRASDGILSSSAIQSLVTSSAHSTPNFARVNGEGQHFRAYTRFFSTPQGEYVLAVLFSLRQPEEFLESIRHSFAPIIPLGILLASIGGYFLACGALAPVVSMSNQASRIGTTNLHDRLTIANERDELGVLADSFNQLLNRLALPMNFALPSPSFAGRPT